jgi:hypothetical protein
MMPLGPSITLLEYASNCGTTIGVQLTKLSFTIIIITRTILIMTLPVTLNTGDITYTGINNNTNKCNIAFIFLSTVISKAINK